MKKYYATRKEYTVFKRTHWFVKMIVAIFRKVYPKTDIIFTEPIPKDEAVVICCNHALTYAPLAFLASYKRPNRMWAAANLCHPKKVPNHVRYCFFPNAHGLQLVGVYMFTAVATPIMPWLFCAMEVIPSYQNIKALVTFDKTIQTINEGKDVVIFPETEVPSENHKYVNKLNGGFLRCADMYYKQTGKILKFYPAYACREFKKVLIGAPITLDPNQPQRPQVTPFKVKMQDAIEALALSLPPHEIVPFNIPLENPEALSKYVDSEKYSYKVKMPENKGKTEDEED